MKEIPKIAFFEDSFYYEGMKHDVIYYSDELNDEFAFDNIVTRKIGGGYAYYHKSLFKKFTRFFWYRLVAFLPAALYLKLSQHHKIVNRKVMKAALNSSTEESTDARRGSGSYQKAISAMKLLKKYGCLFGMSVCYTSENVSFVTSDDFLDTMISLGVKFGLYFSFMPVGHDAPVELIPTPEQREHMYKWLRKTRNGESGKPLFVMDFQDDGEYVGGCIAGGRNYFHINSAGDMEPCVFIHFSDSNIRKKTILEGLRSPLFMAFRRNQPFNDNHLRPCPMLENPQCLRQIIEETGAKSTNLLGEETADCLCSKCDKFAAEWAVQAERIWNSNPHPHPKTQYYRDTPEGRAEAKNKLAE